MLHRRGSVFYSRLIVPHAFRSHVGRREILKSVRTTDRAQAKLKADVWEGHLAELFLLLRRHHETMTPDQIAALVQRYITDSLDAGEEDRSARIVCEDQREAISLAYSDRLEANQSDLLSHSFARITSTADDLLRTHGVTLDKTSEEYRRLCRELLKAEQRVLHTEMERWRGSYAGEADYVDGRRGQMAAPLLPSLPLSKAITKYLDHIKDHAPATLREKRRLLERFVKAIHDQPTNEVKKAQCVQYRDGLTDISRSRVNTILVHIGAFFGWAIKHDLHPGPNPADGIRYEGIETRSHDSFTDEDLTAIFTHPDFLKQRTSEPARYWLPLALLFSGARREEIAGCPMTDLKSDPATGTAYFSLRFDKEVGRRLKNKASIRRAPIHSALLKRGFMDYVEQVKANGSTILFPTDSPARLTAGDAVGKWFSRLVSEVFPNDSRKLSLHSLRSTAITRLHEKGVKGEIVRALVGHSGGDVHEGQYLKRDALSLTVLREAIEQLDFPV